MAEQHLLGNANMQFFGCNQKKITIFYGYHGCPTVRKHIYNIAQIQL